MQGKCIPTIGVDKIANHITKSGAYHDCISLMSPSVTRRWRASSSRRCRAPERLRAISIIRA